MAKKKNEDKIQSLTEEVIDETGFEDNPVIKGKKVAYFSFENEDLNAVEKVDTNKESNDQVVAIRNDETFKRSYMLTKDTIRKVDELKANHPSLTTYVSDIVELAINYYYDYVFKKN